MPIVRGSLGLDQINLSTINGKYTILLWGEDAKIEPVDGQLAGFAIIFKVKRQERFYRISQGDNANTQRNQKLLEILWCR